MKLFAIYVGGEHPQAHIEVHDVRFAVAQSIEGTYDQLRAEWWGKPGTLHVDCWAEITHADGYSVALKPEPCLGLKKLYFVNLGGYDGREFAEAHKNLFVVATSEGEAKTRALRSVTAAWTDAHRDELYEAEQVFALDAVIGERLHIHLTPGPDVSAPQFTCRYTPLN
jgi:hypothetical protein